MDQETPDKYERLLGIYQDIDVEERRYKDKIIAADKILESILDEANPEDNILIFLIMVLIPTMER